MDLTKNRRDSTLKVQVIGTEIGVRIEEEHIS